jgi:NAD(P)-dependent dehydrogenase (short-subunit alcohol dehydrogenase family)
VKKFCEYKPHEILVMPKKSCKMYAVPSGGAVANSGDIANAVRFFVSPRAHFVSGTVLTIDGGMFASQAVVCV